MSLHATARFSAYGDHERLEQCAALSQRVGQLGEAHPLLFFALATNYGPLCNRRNAVRLAELGWPLREVCKAMNIAYALRRIPAEALGRPLTPAHFTERGAQILSTRLLRSAPPEDRCKLLAAAFYGTRIGGEEFGLWLADSRRVTWLPARQFEAIRSVALYAWFSRHPDVLPAMAGKPWTPDMSWPGAVRQTSLWLDRVKFYCYFAASPLSDMWAQGALVSGFDIVPLDTYQKLMEEIADMQNCLHTYADALRVNTCRLFGVQRGGAKIGTVELRPVAGGGLRLAQFRGPRNAAVPLDALEAVHTWLSAQPPVAEIRLRALHDVDCLQRFDSLLHAHAEACNIAPRFWRVKPSIRRLSLELMSLDMPRCRHWDRVLRAREFQ